ncbi:MAG: hypothetical protein HOP07_11820 [Bacteriovoracaceae bacterium]|nr:hypothetical protein [Bacteriovoracaceae bacterium]
MIKGLHFFLILSVVICNSKTSLGQDLKKDLGICGKTMSTLMKFNQAGEPVLESAMVIEANEEFCDGGRYEEHANYKIYLYDQNNTLVYDKLIFLNPLLVIEKLDDKKKGKFKSVKMIPHATSRIVKFPITKMMNSITSYKIQSIETKQSTQIKKIDWLKK